MEISTFPTHPAANLRVYQASKTLETDIFFLTRRFPKAEHGALTALIRTTSQCISKQVVRAWQTRHSGTGFRTHLNECQSACARLALWLDLAYDHYYLSTVEHEEFLERKTELQRMLSRLATQRIALLA
ncbi:MAG TPA: four helix bundle protein [Rhodothermales bacterium]|nr:four helix bundle protein [Rhodothermales bacterium]